MLERTGKILLKLLGICLSAAVALLTVDVLLGVASRYIWGAQIKWTEELATVLLIWVSFLGTAAAFEAKAHLGIDLLVEKLDAAVRRKTGIAVHLTVLVFIILVFELGGIKLVMQAVKHWNIMPALQVSDMVQFLPLPVSGVFILVFELCALKREFQKKEEKQ